MLVSYKSSNLQVLDSSFIIKWYFFVQNSGTNYWIHQQNVNSASTDTDYSCKSVCQVDRQKGSLNKQFNVSFYFNYEMFS
jgi:hypothetical protein